MAGRGWHKGPPLLTAGTVAGRGAGRVAARECSRKHCPGIVLTWRLMTLHREFWGGASLISGCSEPRNKRPEVCLSPSHALPTRCQVLLGGQGMN